jgi:hypothetical protein
VGRYLGPKDDIGGVPIVALKMGSTSGVSFITQTFPAVPGQEYYGSAYMLSETALSNGGFRTIKLSCFNIYQDIQCAEINR